MERGRLMEISISGIENIAKAGLSASINSREPNWSIIPTAGKSNKSDAEFTSEIKELARKAAMAKNKTEAEFFTKRMLQLHAEYLSDVAPDRKLLYQQAKNVLKNQSSNSKCRGIGELTLIDFLEAAEGKNSNLAEKEFTLAGGGTMVCPILTGGGYGVEIHYQSAMVLTNLGRGWGYEKTPAELEKSKEFYDIYWKEYRSITNSEGSEMAELPDYLEDKASFDMKA